MSVSGGISQTVRQMNLIKGGRPLLQLLLAPGVGLQVLDQGCLPCQAGKKRSRQAGKQEEEQAKKRSRPRHTGRQEEEQAEKTQLNLQLRCSSVSAPTVKQSAKPFWPLPAAVELRPTWQQARLSRSADEPPLPSGCPALQRPLLKRYPLYLLLLLLLRVESCDEEGEASMAWSCSSLTCKLVQACLAVVFLLGELGEEVAQDSRQSHQPTADDLFNHRMVAGNGASDTPHMTIFLGFIPHGPN
ncbi:MAG: hypothetical protein FRX49_09321 [Trebouxia sp. A1-2]|nr:MAG: hypothetical protein FRX49_09321 [Trebouxia sp. A1-2]